MRRCARLRLTVRVMRKTSTYRYALVLRVSGTNAEKWYGNSLEDLEADARAAKRLFPSKTYWIYDRHDAKPSGSPRVVRVI